MRELKLEIAIIKVSVLLACLIIGAGTVMRMLETKAEPVSTVGKSSAASNVSTTSPATTNYNPAATTNQQASLPKGKVVAIGDSYTYGYPYGVESSWVALAGKDLNRELVNKGKTSQTSADLLKRFQADVLNVSPEAVIIFVGTGDAMRGITLDAYQSNLQDMVKQAKAKNITPILALPLPYPDSNAAKLISSYRSWLTGYAQSENLKVIDFNPDLVEDGGSLKKQLSDDGKYPNKQGYALMAQTVEKVLNN